MQKAKEFDLPTVRQMTEKSPVRPEFLAKLNKIRETNSKVFILLEQLKKEYADLNDIEPQSENERRVQLLVAGLQLH